MVRPLNEVLKDPAIIRDITQHPDSFRFPDGASVVVTATHWPPHTYLLGPAGDDVKDVRMESGSINIDGPMSNLLSMLADRLNFTYKVMMPVDRAWGNKMANGTWTGMVGNVMREEAEVGLGPFSHTWDRSQVVDFTSNIFFDDRSMLSRKGPTAIDPWSFVLVLAPSVWVGLGVAMLVVLAAILLLSLTVNHDQLGKITGDTLFKQLTTLLNQGVNWRNVKGWERMVLSGWVLVGMVVGMSYSSHLVSVLAVRRIPQPIHSIRKFVDNPKLNMIMTSSTILTAAIDRSTSGEFYELKGLNDKGRMKYYPVKSYPMVMGTLVNNRDHSIMGSSLVLDRLIAQDFTQKGECSFYKSRQRVLSSTHCMIGQKGSPIVPLITLMITRVVEAGLYEHWLSSQVSNFTSCRYSPSIVTVTSSLAISNLWGMLVVWAFGLLISALVFGLELITATFTRLNNSK